MTTNSKLTSAEPTALNPDPSGFVGPMSTETLLWRARFLRASPDLYHLPFLFWLIETTRPNLVVEIGVGEGVSHFATCQGLDKLVRDSRCFGLGDWEDGAVPTELAEYNTQHYEEFSTIQAADPRQELGRFKDGTIDILHVNTKVDESLLSNLQHDWRHKMSPQGVVVLHGLTTHFGSEIGQAFVAELESAIPTIRLENGDGLAAVLFGPRRNLVLKKMAELGVGMAGYSRVHNTLSRLGLLHHYEAGYVEQVEKIAYLRNKHSESSANEQHERELRESLEERLSEISAAYDERSHKIAVVQSEAFDHQSKLLEVQQDYLDLRSQHAENTRQLEQIKSEKCDLQKALTTATKATSDAEERCKALENDLSQLTAAKQEQEARAQEKLREAAAQITKLQDQVEAIEKRFRSEQEIRLGIAKELLSERERADSLAAAVNEPNASLEEDLKMRTDEVRTLTAALERQEDKSIAEIREAKAALAERDKELEKLRKERQLFADLHEEILNSTSWKLTAPVRRIVDRLRGNSV